MAVKYVTHVSVISWNHILLNVAFEQIILLKVRKKWVSRLKVSKKRSR